MKIDDLSKKVNNQRKNRNQMVSTKGGVILTSENLDEALTEKTKRKLEKEILQESKQLREKKTRLLGIEAHLGKKNQERSIIPWQSPGYQVGDIVIYRFPPSALPKIGRIQVSEGEFFHMLDAEKRIVKRKDNFRDQYLFSSGAVEFHSIPKAAILGSLKLNQDGTIPVHSAATRWLSDMELKDKE